MTCIAYSKKSTTISMTNESSSTDGPHTSDQIPHWLHFAKQNLVQFNNQYPWTICKAEYSSKPNQIIKIYSAEQWAELNPWFFTFFSFHQRHYSPYMNISLASLKHNDSSIVQSWPKIPIPWIFRKLTLTFVSLHSSVSTQEVCQYKNLC